MFNKLIDRYDFFFCSLLFSVAKRVGKVHYATNVNHTQVVFMEHAKIHGNAIAKKVGAVCFAIKI